MTDDADDCLKEVYMAVCNRIYINMIKGCHGKTVIRRIMWQYKGDTAE